MMNPPNPTQHLIETINENPTFITIRQIIYLLEQDLTQTELIYDNNVYNVKQIDDKFIHIWNMADQIPTIIYNKNTKNIQTNYFQSYNGLMKFNDMQFTINNNQICLLTV